VRARGLSLVAPQLGDEPVRTLLHPLDVDLAEHRVALIGANGQGKTTFLRLLGGLAASTSGELTLDGVGWGTHGRRLRGRVGTLFADTAAQLIMPTVIEDVELSLRPRRLPRAERRRTAFSHLAALGVERLAERSVYELSGGERQLVALAGLRAAGASLLLADEPTAALDLVNRDRVADALLHQEAALIVATHDLDLAAACERVLWIHDGRLVDDGAPDAVVPRYVDAARGRVPWPVAVGRDGAP